MIQSQLAALTTWMLPSLGDDVRGMGPKPLLENALLPFITLTKISGKEMRTHDNEPDEETTTFQFDCWAKSYESANMTREAIKALFRTHPITAGDYTIDAGMHLSSFDHYDGERRLHVAVIRMTIVFYPLT